MKNTHLYVYSYNPEISDKLQKQETVIKNWYQAGKQMDRHPPTHRNMPPPHPHHMHTHTTPQKRQTPTHPQKHAPPPQHTHHMHTPPPPKKEKTDTHPPTHT